MIYDLPPDRKHRTHKKSWFPAHTSTRSSRRNERQRAQVPLALGCFPASREQKRFLFGWGGSVPKKPRRVSRPQARNRVPSFSPVTCAPEKILLSPQVCELAVEDGQRVRAGGCIPSVGRLRRSLSTVSAPMRSFDLMAGGSPPWISAKPSSRRADPFRPRMSNKRGVPMRS